MLSSIHPLGERARGNRWSTTVAALTAGSAVTGAIGGALLGWAASFVVDADSFPPLVVVTAAVILAGALDLLGIGPPTLHRQVNERWIGTYRGWVYGAGFGVQLGAGFATFVVTWLTWAVPLAAFLTATAQGGMIVGATFGFARSWTVLGAGVIDRPTRLTSFHRRMASLATGVHRTAAATAIAIGALEIATW